MKIFVKVKITVGVMQFIDEYHILVEIILITYIYSKLGWQTIIISFTYIIAINDADADGLHQEC